MQKILAYVEYLCKRIKMRNKSERLNMIKQIVGSEIICSQDDLLRALMKRGVELTQATLSRDLKVLKITRSFTDEGQYRYVLPQAGPLDKEFALRLTGDGSIEFSGNLAIMKTRSGHASGIAAEIDSIANRQIIGTLAGDDTILIILRENCDRDEVRKILSGLINKQ